MNQSVSGQSIPYDPNLYLSTTAQSTAALVAIIGGFLVSRLIGLVSEKTQQVQSLAELQSKRRIKDAELEKFNRAVGNGIQKWFREDNLEDILSKRGDSNYTKMVDDFDATGSDRQEIAEYANTLKAVVTRAFREVEQKYKEPLKIPTTSTKMRADGILIEPGHDEEIFDRVASYITEVRQANHQEEQGTGVETLDSQNNSSTGPSDPVPVVLVNPPAPTLVTSRHDAAIKQRDRLNEELRIIVGEVELLEFQLTARSQQRWLIYGFAILAYFSLVGIVYPLYLMTRNPVEASAAARITVLLGFISGLIALLTFIWSAVADLRGIEKRVGKAE